MFDIRDYINQLTISKETNTQWKCICLICGDKHLTISKASGAYKCFTNFCPNHLIRDKLSPSNKFFVKDKVFVKDKIFAPVKKTYLNIELANGFDICIIKRLNTYCYLDNYKIVYVYDSCHKVEKVIDKSGRKVIYPKYLDKNDNKWYYGVDMSFKPFKPFDTIISGDTLIIVEGEKCAYTVSDLNIGAISFRSYSEQDIISNINYIYKYFGICKYLYITDNDVTGDKKADCVKQILNSCNKQCSIIRIKSLFDMFNLTCNHNDDIYDFLQVCKVDLKQVLESWRF